MSIVRLDGVRREIGDFVILDSVTAALARGERVGLVGANGAGKTTLLEIVAGREEADAGSVHLARGLRVGLLTQEANFDPDFRVAPTVRAVVRRGAIEIERMELQLADLEARGADAVQSREYAELRERFEAVEGYHLDHRVEASLTGLGIPRSHWEHKPSELSGGEQTRVALARLVTADPDLLMLDEPTNHLDIAALEWLEATLVRRERALLVASHDRAFLDNVVQRIWELRAHRVAMFKGGYSAYLLQRESADARARSVAASTDAAIARETDLVQRYRSQRKHVKMHEHERRLDALKAGRADTPARTARLTLPGGSLQGSAPARSAEIAVSLEDVLCGYPAVDGDAAIPITRVARLEARRGERIGLVGPNGAGKSTLLRTIAGKLPALEGFVRIGRNVMPGYLAQLRDQPLGPVNVLDALTAAAAVTPGQARSYLARFLFRGDDVLKPVSELSGGERSRLELALLGVGAANLLLLDEPTNHLDIPAREALEAFLRETEATLIIVSHDRRLLESSCERLWVVEPSSSAPASVAAFAGSYREWRAAVADGWSVAATLAARDRATSSASSISGSSPQGSASPREAAATNGAATHGIAPLSKDAYRRERRRVDADMSQLSDRKANLEARLEDPKVQANFVELRRLGSELADIDQALSQAEDAWLVLEERAPE